MAPNVTLIGKSQRPISALQTLLDLRWSYVPINPEVENIVKSKIDLIHLTYCHHNLADLKHAQNTISTKILATPYTVEYQLFTLMVTRLTGRAACWRCPAHERTLLHTASLGKDHNSKFEGQFY